MKALYLPAVLVNKTQNKMKSHVVITVVLREWSSQSLPAARSPVKARLGDQLWTQSGSIDPKLDKSGDFFWLDSVHFDSPKWARFAPNGINPGIRVSPFWLTDPILANQSYFWPKYAMCILPPALSVWTGPAPHTADTAITTADDADSECCSAAAPESTADQQVSSTWPTGKLTFECQKNCQKTWHFFKKNCQKL